MRTTGFWLAATLAAGILTGCVQQKNAPQGYAEMILENELMNRVDSMARAVVSTGFNAGDGYGEVWIRDYNTFIELSMDVLPDEQVRRNLNVFWGFIMAGRPSPSRQVC